MTSSCVAVEDWTTTFWGGDVGTRRRAEAESSVTPEVGAAPRARRRGNIPASPTNTSCGALLGPSPTALYTLRRIS